MLVHSWIGLHISLFFQGSVGIKPTKNTHHLLPLGTRNLTGIDSDK
ncbi:hypothetical protein MXB_1657 [Myxobolus squamalis]|nr:hypothetical protein MXB_1657 [Myxobolus squamalis]